MANIEIKAELIRDHKGRLLGIREIDIIHYSIQLFIENYDENVEKVTYELHESYLSGKIDVKKGVPKFLTEITSYGDYDVKANIHYKDKIESITGNLFEMLAKKYKNDKSPEIITALEQIKRL